MIPTVDDIGKRVVTVSDEEKRRKNRKGILHAVYGDICAVQWEGTRYKDRVHKGTIRVMEDDDESGYVDPLDLRAIPDERLKWEGNRQGLQFKEWNDLFNVEVGIRRLKMVEIEKWSIFSNRYLIRDRKDSTDQKLFTKEEVLREIETACHQMYQNGKFGYQTQHEVVKNYIDELKKKL